MNDITRDATLEMKKGVRDARVYGWSWLHVCIAETGSSTSYGINLMIARRYSLSLWFQAVE